MSVSGMKKDEWVAATYCDFGCPTRREQIRNHFSIESALNAFAKVSKIYSRHGRCWQETREGEIINDSNHNRQTV
jgi:hypothetical protein